jgi:hypothetical protein
MLWCIPLRIGKNVRGLRTVAGGDYFGHGSHAAPQEIHHARTPGGCSLRVMYDDHGTLTKVLAGPDLQPGEIEELENKIKQELLTPGPIKVRRRILFSTVPTQGSFRYEDRFQILPVPPEAPQLRFSLGDHPFVLEISYGASSNFMVSNLRQERVGRQLELVLSSLLKFPLRSIGPATRFHWSLDFSGDRVTLPSKFLQEEYAWDGAVSELDQFSPLDEHPALAMIDVTQYYSGILRGRIVELPSDIKHQLARFFALSAHDKETFLRASFWFQQAHRVSHLSKSASFPALVSAIETFIPPPGSAKQFFAFVDVLSPGIAEPDRKRFYRLRAALSHGGKLLLADQGRFWGFTPQQLGQWQDISIMWKIVQTVLHNWLREHSQE